MGKAMLSFILTNAASHPPTYTVGYPSRESVSPFIPLVASPMGGLGHGPELPIKKPHYGWVSGRGGG